MSLLDDFARVDRQTPCPICEKPDWCLTARDGSAAICERIESEVRYGEAGWLHPLRDEARRRNRRTRTFNVCVLAGNGRAMASIAAHYQDDVDPFYLRRLAAELGVSAQSLRRGGIGWTGRAWSFPMLGADGRVCGIRLRTPEGQKLAVRGSRNGLFIPRNLRADEMLLVAEGPTDSAALLDLGFSVIGRPSCSGGAKLVVAYVRATQPERVVIVADADEVGRKGAYALAPKLRAICSTVQVVEPERGAKDARAWVNAGATREEVLKAIEQAKCVQLHVLSLRGWRP